jgi:O-antigen ligase
MSAGSASPTPPEALTRPASGHRRVWEGIDAALYWLWLLAAALAPVWFGANTPLAWGAHAAMFGFVLAAYGADRLVRNEPLPVPLRRLIVPLVAIGIVLAWAAIQTVPWVPAAWRHPIWGMLAPVVLGEVPGAISVYPAGGWMAILWTATAAAVFLLGVQFGRDPARARTILWVVALTGGAVAAYGLLVYLTGNNWVLWRPKLAFLPPDHAYLKALTATFINPDNFASYAGIVAICILGLAADRVLRHAEPVLGGLVLPAILFAVVSAALVLTGSRAGVAATLLGLATLSILPLARLTGRRLVFFVLLTIGGLAIVALGAGFGARLSARLPELGQDLASRLAIDARILAAIRASPWLGYGYGAFEQAFAMFRDTSLSPHNRIEYAHNDWLEALMTLGIPVGLLLWLVFGWVLARCLAGALRRGRDAVYPAIGAGCCVLALSHALVDFSLQIQGFAIPLMALLGVGIAQSWSTARQHQ